MATINPRDAGYGGKLDPDPPGEGTRFRALGSGGPAGMLCVAALITIADDWHRPKSFLVRAEDGAFWVLVSCDPILDGVAYTGTKMVNA